MIKVNIFNCNTSEADCDYQNQYCVDHSLYSREIGIDQNGAEVPATSETDGNQLTIADNLVCAGYPALYGPNDDQARVNRRQ